MSLKRKLLLLVILPVVIGGGLALGISSLKIRSQGLENLEDKSNSILDLYTMHFLRYHTDGSMSEDNLENNENLLKDSYTFRIVSQNPFNELHRSTEKEREYENKIKKDSLSSLKIIDSETEEMHIVRPVYYSDQHNCAFCHNQNEDKKASYEGEIRGLFIVSTSMKPVNENVKSSIFQISGLSSIIAILAIVLGILVIRRISNSFNSIITASKKISEGDLTATLQIKSKDELGVIAESLNQMIHSLKRVIESITKGASELAHASELISTNSSKVAHQATEQASSIEELSASMQQMVATIEQNTYKSQQTKEVAENAAIIMNQVGSSTNKSMEAINSISQKIAIINDIASQTNILALNAAVEAARAGSAGRGFAVVANEVKNLAYTSNKAADEIIGLSKSTVNITIEASELVTKTLPQIESTAKLIQQVNEASKEQSISSEQINAVIMALNNATQHNASAAESMSASAVHLNSQAQNFKKLVSFFKVNNNSV